MMQQLRAPCQEPWNVLDDTAGLVGVLQKMFSDEMRA